MATATKTPRLLAAAKEFNIGKETLVEYLTNKGFEFNASNPNTKLTEEMYDALQAEFAQDRLAKRKSEEIALPKGSLLDNLKKTKDDLDLGVRDKKEEPEVAAPAPKKEEPLKEQEKVKEKVPEAKAPETKASETPSPTPEESPAKKTAEHKKTEEPVEEKKHAAEEKKATAEKQEEQDSEGHIKAKSQKLEGPNVLGKINLEELNLSSRPKKGATKKKTKKEEEPEAKANEEITEAPANIEIPAAKETQPEEKPQRPVVAETKEVIQEDTDQDEENGDRPEHIEMKAPKLEGPKIIGKIVLPVAGNNAAKGDNKDKDRDREKRKRKRIPVEKKPETFKPDQQGQNRDRNQNNNRSGQGGHPGGGQGQNNRPQNFNRGQGGGHGQQGGGQGQFGGQQRGGQGQHSGGQQRSGGGGQQRGGQQHGGGGQDRRGGGRFQPRPAITPQQQEIDTKAIQDKIRETQAKLTGATRSKSLKAKYRRNKREEMAEKRAAAEQSEQTNVIQVTEFISVSELANLLNVSFADVISKCMSLGIMVSINQRLDAEVIELVSSEFGYDVEFIDLEQETEIEEEEVDDEEDLQPRAPIVTIMGHVDHGKTSLLDYIRSANVVAGEAGGITQHIGAYQVTTNGGKKITFLDTPGHEAFTAMRARGAKAADVAVIVIAADDAIMPQTKEAISHAQAASLPMIFAINKIDKEGANPEKIKEQLANMNILVEDWGGKYQSQEISAKKGLNVDLLLDKILLEAELLDLKANPDKNANGSVIEASLDKGRGYQSTILVQSGTLNQGDMIVCGQYYGKIKAMFNERGQRVNIAGPSAPVQVLGLNGAPQAGEKFKVFEDENEAKEMATHRSQIMREQGIRTRKHITLDEIGRRLALGNFKELGIIIKGDFDGSVEALSDSLQKLSTEEVAVNVVHKGVGQITESDVLLATASDAIIVGFQVRPSMQAARLAEQENIEIRTYSIIYDAIEEIKSAMEGLLEPKVEKRTVANIEVREVFKISGVGTIAGCYVLDGKVTRNTRVNLVRDGIVTYTGELASLKRFKDDAKEVNAGYECGLSIKNYNDVRVGDIIEGFEEVEVKRTL
ncbi:MAG TPA: translation initiation factor IF-2 [Flavipsychrobacter sp.]|nr:translation initiation factor IF-2 [Flavipsychrobacter sp.]